MTTTTQTLPPSPAAALYLLRGIGVLGPTDGLPRTDDEWERLPFLRPSAKRRLVLLARSLCTTEPILVPIAQILDEVAFAQEAHDTTRPPVWVVLEALAIAAGMPRRGAEIAAAARQASSGALASWQRDGWSLIQAATTLIARKALREPQTYLGEVGLRYDWRYAARYESFVDAAVLGEAFASDVDVDVGKILRANAGGLNNVYLAAFTVAAGLVTDEDINDMVLWELHQAVVHDGLTPDYPPATFAC